jgi:protoheme IX farnesyltransferase
MKAAAQGLPAHLPQSPDSVAPPSLQPAAPFRNGLWGQLQDYGDLIKGSVTSLIVMTAWCGFYFGALKSGTSSISWTLLHALLGIGLASGGTAALNEVLERDVDRRMRRTSTRPLPGGRMSLTHAIVLGLVMTVGGSVYLGLATNWLTGLLTFATSLTYLAVYTPLKKVHPICTFVGAFPGAMPGVLGWTAARGHLEIEAVVLFAIVFCWQFPHFFSIAWLYREDYALGNICMLPVVAADGKSTLREILLYSVLLIPVSCVPTFVGMSGRIYLAGAAILGVALLYCGYRLARLGLAPTVPQSKPRARQLLQATVFYLPLLFGLMMINAAR